MAGLLNGLDTALTRSESTLTEADKSGMEVSEAQVKLLDGKENLIKARLMMHSFRTEDMRKPVEAGMGIAAETERAGEAALHEKDVRRIGLAVAVFFISITVAAIFLLLRRQESDGSGYLEAQASQITKE